MSNEVILIGFILTLCFGTGLSIRLKQGKRLILSVDSILFLQLFTILLFWCPIFHSYFIGPYLLSLMLSMIWVIIDKSKTAMDKILILGILFPPFISLFSKLEHWWWASYASYTMVLAALVFIITLFYFPKKIENELPYLSLFAFEILLTTVQLFFPSII